VNYCDTGTANSASVIGNDIFGNASAGIRLKADTTGYGCGGPRRGLVNGLVSGNWIHGNLYGIQGLASLGPYETMGTISATIQNNLIVNNTEDGVRFDADQGSHSGNFAELAAKMINNTIIGNVGSGISSATNIINGFSILNNLVVKNNNGISLDAVVTTTNFVVSCNDVWANGLGNWVYCPAYGTLSTNNLNGTAADASLNITADPLLGGIDGYHLTAGSPAVDAGTTNSAPTTDAESHARLGPPDLGCYELSGPLLTLASRPVGGSFGVVVTGGRGLTYTMEATTNFGGWFTVTNLTMTNGVMQSSLPILPAEQHLFYRAKW
jgi:hypothetical protein